MSGPNAGRKPLEGKVAIVTGAARAKGLGRGIARRLGQDGAQVVLTDVTPTGLVVVESKAAGADEGLTAGVAELAALGATSSQVVADIGRAEDVARIIDHVQTTHGRLDILVNNAAALPGADRVPFTELSEAAWDHVINVNLKGAFLMTQAAARVMIDQGQGGRIINISSITAKVGYLKMAVYSASKAGILGLSRALALELAPAGITVNAICPGLADTERIDYVGVLDDGEFDPELRARRLLERGDRIPMGRVATPEDIGAIAAFLAGEQAGYLTGEFINAAGGMAMD